MTSFISQILSHIKLPQSTQKRFYAFTKDRNVLLIVALFFTAVTGPAYVNWSPLRECLYRSGAYTWLCSNDSHFDPSKMFGSRTYQCDAQFLKVNKIISITTYCHYFWSFFAGILLDWIGPKKTGIFGTCALMLGWSLIGTSNYSHQHYFPGFILMAIGLESSFLPLLGIAKLFHGKESFITSLLGSSRALAMFFPLLFHILVDNTSSPGNTFKNILYIYSLGGIGVCLLLTIIFIPWEAWLKFNNNESTSHSREFNITKESSSTIEHKLTQDLLTTHGNFETPSLKNTDNVLENSSLPKDAINFNNMISYDLPSNYPTSSNHMSYLNSIEHRSPQNNNVWTNIVNFLREMTTMKFFFIAVHSMIFLLRDVYFSAASEKLVPDVLNEFAICAILSFIPAPLFGYLGDKIGIIWVMQLLNFASFQMYLFASIPSIPAPISMQWVSIITYVFVISFVLSQVYCFGVLHFPQKHMGKLIGIITSLGGVSSLIAHPLLEHSTQSRNFFSVNLGIMIVSVINSINLLFLHFYLKRHSNLKRKKSINM